MRKFLKELAPRGIPVLGSGLIFPVTDDQITCKPIDYIPQHWPQLGAMDFGWEHPFAAVQLAWDRDADVVYVTKAYRMSRGTPVTHAGALRGWGRELRWAWPRDGKRNAGRGRHCLGRAVPRSGLEHAPGSRPVR